MPHPHTLDSRLSRQLSQALGIACFVVGAFFLLTWWLAPAAQPAPGNIRLAPNTAVSLILLGLAVWSSVRGSRRWLGRSLAAVVLAIALVTLLEYACQWGSVIDHWVVPGVNLRPSLQTAVSLVFAGLAVTLLDVAPNQRLRPSEVFAVCGMTIPLLGILGFAYGISPLYQTSPQAGMSLPTALLVIVVCLAALLARPTRGGMAFVTGPSLGGALLRALAPITLVLPSVLGWLILAAVPGPHEALANRVALLMVAFTLLLLALLVAAAALIDRLDAARQRANQVAEAAQAEQLAALEDANRHLSQLNQYKDRFLGILSHELRTPLNFIMGFASILEDGLYGPLNAQQQTAVRKIMAGSERLTHLVADILDVARIQAGKLSLTVTEVDYAQVVREVVDTLTPLAAAKHQTLEADLCVPPGVCVDEQRMNQVLTNLIDNAIKFTPNGGLIRIEAMAEGDALVTRVTDSGAGIDVAHQAIIFERFTQVDMSSTRAAGGVGLGLSIARGLVEAHGGTLSVMSQAGKGSTFSVSIPLETALAPATCEDAGSADRPNAPTP